MRSKPPFKSVKAYAVVAEPEGFIEWGSGGECLAIYERRGRAESRQRGMNSLTIIPVLITPLKPPKKIKK